MKAEQRQQDVLEGADSAWIAPVIPFPCGRCPIEVDADRLEHDREPHRLHPSNPKMLHPRQPVEGRHRRLDTRSVPVAVLERGRLLRRATARHLHLLLVVRETVPFPHRLDRALFSLRAPQTESPRVCRRLHHLRGWGHEQTDAVPKGST